MPGQALERQTSASVSQQELLGAIGKLGAFDFSVRLGASRLVRRASPALAIPALREAVRNDRDSYVQYRALVLLTGFDDPAMPELIRSLLTDRNDRLRSVAYAWFEHHPTPSVVPSLSEALAKERSEFVRPALTRALAAHKTDARAVAAIVPLVSSGENFFRAEVIQAVGDYRVTAAREAVLAVAKVDGPLQEDAIVASGKLGDAAMLAELAELQRTVSRERQPSIAAAICLLGVNCDAHRMYLAETLKFASETAGFQPLLRSAARALGALASRGDQAAWLTLLGANRSWLEASRAPVALAAGGAALRDPDGCMRALAAIPDPRLAVEILRDAFDMLEEDFEEERFLAEVRRAYWEAADGSVRRRIAELLLQTLES